jgi:uncharacterized phage infection (PIP) family protein YhgE
MTTPIPEEPTKTAIIIPFPIKKNDSVKREIPQINSKIDPQTRLVNALAKLQEALAMQKAAVANFRENLGTLKETVQGLGSSLQSYNDKLDNLKSGVETIGDHSRKTVEILKDF